jgi:hypothetical protein
LQKLWWHKCSDLLCFNVLMHHFHYLISIS